MITVAFQFGGRPHLEKISRDFLSETLKGNDITWEELDCTNKTIGKGFNELIEKVKTKYVLWTPDDFAFFSNGDWIGKSIRILENRPDIGFIDLRKERDGESPWSIDSREFIGNQSFYITHSWDNRGFNLTPFIMKTEDLKKLLPLDESDTTGNVAESSGYERYKKIDHKL
jgi:hypothetical protein